MAKGPINAATGVTSNEIHLRCNPSLPLVPYEGYNTGDGKQSLDCDSICHRAPARTFQKWLTTSRGKYVIVASRLSLVNGNVSTFLTTKLLWKVVDPVLVYSGGATGVKVSGNTATLLVFPREERLLNRIEPLNVLAINLTITLPNGRLVSDQRLYVDLPSGLKAWTPSVGSRCSTVSPASIPTTIGGWRSTFGHR